MRERPPPPWSAIPIAEARERALRAVASGDGWVVEESPAPHLLTLGLHATAVGLFRRLGVVRARSGEVTLVPPGPDALDADGFLLLGHHDHGERRLVSRPGEAAVLSDPVFEGAGPPVLFAPSVWHVVLRVEAERGQGGPK